MNSKAVLRGGRHNEGGVSSSRSCFPKEAVTPLPQAQVFVSTPFSCAQAQVFPVQVFAQQGSEPGQTKVMPKQLVLERMDLTLYLNQEQTSHLEKSGWHSFSLKCLTQLQPQVSVETWKTTKIRDSTRSEIPGICMIGLGWSEQLCIFLSVTTQTSSGIKVLLQLHPATGNVDGALVV